MDTARRSYNDFPPVDADMENRSPGEGFVKMPLPQGAGYHTGGVYLSPDGYSVFKPLDCRTDHGDGAPRIRTQEDTVLEVMVGLPGFPRNWHIAERNRRLWLVRPLSLVVLGSFLLTELQLRDVLVIEAGIRALNERNWDLGDTLEVAIDPQTREPFVLDLSCAYYRGPKSPEIYRDDTLRFNAWAERVGFSSLVSFRWAARHVVGTARFGLKYPKEYRNVYAAMYEPPLLLSDLQDPLVIEADHEKTGVYAWIVLPTRIETKQAEELRLTWGWSPLVYEER